jgi:Zn finger protein HypA/HybF involved in hydrogenase expression
MYCHKCKIKMKEEGRSFHKKRKWVCPVCGRAKLQVVPARRKQVAGKRT